MARRISCKQLAEVLNGHGLFPEITWTANKLRHMCEAYGRDVRCYLYIGDEDLRSRVQDVLRIEGVKWNDSYRPEEVLEIPVSYFKALHHNQ
jgi:hypothetical protein